MTARVCVEFLPLSELSRREVRELLLACRVAPMLAAKVVDNDPRVQAEADAAVARALAIYREAGLVPCVWPLLPDADGYWPSALNAARVGPRAEALLSAAERAGAPFVPGDLVAVDLEPPITAREAGTRALLAGCDPARFSAARATFAALARSLRARGLRTLAIAYPLVSADGGGTFFQRRCMAPLECGWDLVSIMTYSSLIAGWSRGLLSVADARRYGYLAQADLGRRFPGRAAAFIGLSGPGKLGNEPAHDHPEALFADAAAARAAGAVEVTAFCLEGILKRPDPRAWLAALSAPPQAPPRTLRGDLLHRALRVCGHLA